MSVTIEGVEYVRKDSISSTAHKWPLEIVVLPYGNVLIGRVDRNTDTYVMHDAQVIRRWGTDSGLGQLAKDGKQENTKLDPCNGVTRFNKQAVIYTIECEETAWK